MSPNLMKKISSYICFLLDDSRIAEENKENKVLSLKDRKQRLPPD